VIRPARPSDVPAIYELIRDLAAYERSLPEVTGTQAQLRESLFGMGSLGVVPPSQHGAEPAVFAHVAEHEGTVVGFALWFLNYSTWLCTHGIYLEDLYVRPDVRGHGYGRQLLAELAALCVERGYGRLEWWVLDWNEPALGFYRSLGAEPMSDWTVHRVTGQALADLAASRDPA
jgi:GNAT superfamily N-acetyltransferase